MKYLKQFCIILTISFIGELLGYIIPMPIPASIYGIILLFLGLMTGIIPLDSVKETGKFLVDIMPVMFIPPAVKLLDSWGILRSSIIQYMIIVVSTTVCVMGVAGRVTQHIVRKEEEKKNA